MIQASLRFAVTLVAMAILSTNARAVDLLDQIQVVRDGVGGVNGIAGPAYVDLSPDGNHLYVAGIFDNGVGVFSRNTTTGQLTFVEAEIDGISGVSGLQRAFGVAVSPDGNHVYIAGQSDSVAVFSRNSVSGALSFEASYFDNTGGIDGIDAANSVVVSPDNQHVYVGGGADNAIAVFSRNTTTGELTFVESQDDDLGDNGARGVFWVSISDDGNNVYCAGSTDDAIGVFSRNVSNGRLTPIQQVRGDGLDGVSSVKLSPDQRHVYTAATEDDAVAVFSRNLANGLLTPIEVESDRLNGIDGILGAFSVAVSEDGNHVFAATVEDSAVVAFSRDSATGEIEFIQVLRDNFDGNDGLAGACAVIGSPDSKHVYAVGFNENAVPAFERAELGAMNGSIRDANSEAGIACAVVEISGGGTTLTAVTDVNGGYSFVGLTPDTYSVRVVSVGFTELTPAPVVINPGDSVSSDYDLTARNATGGIRGTVTDAATNAPLAGVQVDATIGASLVASTYTCASGQFEFDGLVQKGPVQVRLDFDATNYDPEFQNVNVSPGNVTEVTQDLTKAVGTNATLTGMVTNGSSAIVGAQVTIRGAFNASRTTDSDGVYVFNDVIAGNYTIRASATDFQGESANWGVQSGRVTQKNFVLSPLGLEDAADLNGDGNVNAIDVQLVINVVLGINTSVDGDVDGNGQTNAVDVQLVINTVLGL